MAAISRWVWTKGIAALCDRRIPDEFPDGVYVHHPSPLLGAGGANLSAAAVDLIPAPELFDDVAAGALVWVRGTYLAAFVHQVLPRLRVPVVLVTGDADSSFPSDGGPHARAVLESPMVLHWFTQNHDGSGPPARISGIPIGLDLHTVSQEPAWGEQQASPEQQEAALADIVAVLPPVDERILQVYVDLSWSAGWGHVPRGARLQETRAEVIEKLRGNPCVVHQEERLSRSEMWRRKGQYAFSIGPHGNGLDCHRTWESLALGQVVLVPTSSLDPLFTGTRGVPLASWDDITLPHLVRWLARSLLLPEPDASLSNEHWVARMRRVAHHGSAS